MSSPQYDPEIIVNEVLGLPATELELAMVEACTQFPELCNFLATKLKPEKVSGAFKKVVPRSDQELLMLEVNKGKNRIIKTCKFYEKERRKGFHSSAIADSFETSRDWGQYIQLVLQDMSQELKILERIEKKEFKEAYELWNEMENQLQNTFNQKLAGVMFAKVGRNIWNFEVDPEEELLRKSLTIKEIFDEVCNKANLRFANDASSGDSVVCH